jgi:hypothetical protein
MSDMIKIGIYVKSQGVIGGFFLIVGLFFSSFQRINQTADEFATAMIEAGENIYYSITYQIYIVN